MRSAEFLKQMSRALRERGMSRRAEKRLLAEYRDHMECMVEKEFQEGAERPEAEIKTVTAMGEPDRLADDALEIWRSNLWTNRRPCLFGLTSGGMTILSILLFLTVIFALPSFYYRMVIDADTPELRYYSSFINLTSLFTQLGNWLPACLGGIWVGWLAGEGRLKNRSFWLGCAGVALAGSLVYFKMQTPFNGPGTGSLVIFSGPVLTLLSWPILEILDLREQMMGNHAVERIFYLPSFLQMVLPFLIAWIIASVPGNFLKNQVSCA